MSTSRNTKTYWRLVRRIGSKLEFAVNEGREQIQLYEFVRAIYPKATARMIEDVL